jgi:hypothetical protein
MRGRESSHTNMLRQIFDPNDFRSVIVNWEEIASELLRHLHNEVASSPSDQQARDLLDEILAYPDVPVSWRQLSTEKIPSPLMTTILQRDEQRLSFFSTITTFGTPRDVTLDDLHIESCFPVDEETAAFCQKLRREDP